MFHPESLLTFSGLISLVTLVLMEIVLGIDNVIFISILTGKLPREQQGRARAIGLSMALVFRILLLCFITFILGLKAHLFEIPGYRFKLFEFVVLETNELGISWRDLILLGGGLFLTYKSVGEIIERFHVKDDENTPFVETKSMSLSSAIFQIIILDIVFSLDSILTAVTIADEVIIMIIAVVISMIVMLTFSGIISDFINHNPTIRMLALAFLVMIGVLLSLEAFHVEVHSSYLYAAMGFSLAVEILNMQVKRIHTKAEMETERKRKEAELLSKQQPRTENA